MILTERETFTYNRNSLPLPALQVVFRSQQLNLTTPPTSDTTEEGSGEEGSGDGSREKRSHYSYNYEEDLVEDGAEKPSEGAIFTYFFIY